MEDLPEQGRQIARAWITARVNDDKPRVVASPDALAASMSAALDALTAALADALAAEPDDLGKVVVAGGVIAGLAYSVMVFADALAAQSFDVPTFWAEMATAMARAGL